MLPESITRILDSRDAQVIFDLLDDCSCVFWVDWRQDMDEIVANCKQALQVRRLSTQRVRPHADADVMTYVRYQNERVRVPTHSTRAGRDSALRSLDELVRPRYEIRVSADCLGHDAMAFIAMSAVRWSVLDARYGVRARLRFRPLYTLRRLFIDRRDIAIRSA